MMKFWLRRDAPARVRCHRGIELKFARTWCMYVCEGGIGRIIGCA
jgi:hypothetical protein